MLFRYELMYFHEMLYCVKYLFTRTNDQQVDELPSKNQALCAFCVTCIVLLCVNLLYSLCKLNHC